MTTHIPQLKVKKYRDRLGAFTKTCFQLKLNRTSRTNGCANENLSGFCWENTIFGAKQSASVFTNFQLGGVVGGWVHGVYPNNQATSWLNLHAHD